MNSMKDLANLIRAEWEVILQAFPANFVNSMPNKIAVLLRVHILCKEICFKNF